MKVLLLLSIRFLFTGVFANQADTLSLLFLGDIMQHQSQIDAARKEGILAASKTGYDYSGCFRYMAGRFEKADLTIANMETTFSRKPYTGYPSFSSPPSLLKAVHDSGVDIFLAANNHICDKGSRGLKKTIELYDSLKIQFTGIYRSGSEELKKNPLIVEKKGFRIAFLNYTYGTNTVPVPYPYVVNLADTSAMSEDILITKALNPDFIVVCIHWGEEYKRIHSSGQEKIENFLNSKGVDIIIGSHPHVPQGKRVTFNKDGKVEQITFYSLGNAISNMTAPYTRIGLTAKIFLVKDIFGNTEILPPESEFIWTSLPGRFDNNYTILPIADYADSSVLFKVKDDYENMMRYYSELNK